MNGLVGIGKRWLGLLLLGAALTLPPLLAGCGSMRHAGSAPEAAPPAETAPPDSAPPLNEPPPPGAPSLSPSTTPPDSIPTTLPDASLIASTDPLAPAAPPLKRDVPFVPTREEVVRAMLRLADVTKSDVLYDLGCGDGRIVITAAKRFGARATGVDIDPQRIQESNQNAAQAGVADQVRFLQQDLFTVDLRPATVVTLYLLPSVNLRLRPKLFSELRPGTRIVSNSFDMDAWRPDKTEVALGANLYYWVVPANASGRWSFTLPGQSQPCTLELTQRFQEAQGTLTMGAAALPVRDAKVIGDRLLFSVVPAGAGRGGPMTFDGRIAGDALSGSIQGAQGSATQSWSAQRDPGSMKPIEQPATSRLTYGF